MIEFDRVNAAVVAGAGVSVSGTRCGVLLDIGGSIGLAGQG